MRGFQEFKSGEAFSGIYYAHEWFTRIPRGRVTLKLTCPVYVIGKEAEDVCTEVAVDVLPATPERVEAVRRRIEDRWDGRKRTAHEGDPIRWILGCRHGAFVPLALRIIERHWPGAFLPYPLLDFSYYHSDAPEEVHARIVALACRPGWKLREDLFSYWFARDYDDPNARDEVRERLARRSYDYQYWPIHRTPLPAREFGKRLKAKDPWTRILTCVTFPRGCPRDWKRSLLEDCRRLTRPLPAGELAAFLRDLDDDTFAVRERASAALAELGEPVVSPLRQALQTPLSPEVKRRIRAALEMIAASPVPPDRDQIFEFLSSVRNSPEAEAILAALAEGDAAFFLTQAAKAAILQRQKNRSPGG